MRKYVSQEDRYRILMEDALAVIPAEDAGRVIKAALIAAYGPDAAYDIKRQML